MIRNQEEIAKRDTKKTWIASMLGVVALASLLMAKPNVKKEELMLTVPVSGSVLLKPTAVLEGIAPAGSQIDVYANNFRVKRIDAVPKSGKWDVAIQTTPGDYEIEINQLDSTAMKVVSESRTYIFTVLEANGKIDRPVAIFNPATKGPLKSGPLTISGLAKPYQAVTVAVGDSKQVAVTADEKGVWEAPITIAEGVGTIVAKIQGSKVAETLEFQAERGVAGAKNEILLDSPTTPAVATKKDINLEEKLVAKADPVKPVVPNQLKVEKTIQARAEAKPVVETPKVEAKVEPKVEVKPAPKPVVETSKAEAKPIVKPEAKIVVKEQTKSEAVKPQIEAKPVPKVVVKTAPKPVAKPAVKAAVKPANKPAVKVLPKVETKVSPKPISPTPVIAQSNVFIQIQKGDSLSKLAAKFKTTVASLKLANPRIKNANLIFAGSSLKVPKASAVTVAKKGVQEAGTTVVNHMVKKGDSLSKIAVEHGIGYAKILKLNSHISNPNLIYAGQKVHLSR